MVRGRGRGRKSPSTLSKSTKPAPSLDHIVEVVDEEWIDEKNETDPGSAFTPEFLKNELISLRQEISKQLLIHKDEIIGTLREENLQLRNEISSLKKEIDEKDKLLHEVEKDVIDVQQYIRRNNVEICGIPDEVDDNNLENKVIEIAKIIDVNIDIKDIEACHRLKSRYNSKGPKRTIVRFINRKNCDNLHKNKKKLKDNNDVKNKLKSIGIANNVFINNNLCPYNKMLWGKCKRLLDANMISRFWVFNGSIYFAISDDDSGIKIDHLRKLQSHFPNFDFNAVYVA